MDKVDASGQDGGVTTAEAVAEIMEPLRLK